MRHHGVVLFCAALASLPREAPAQAPATPLPTAQSIIARHVEATGGDAAHAAIRFRHTVVRTGIATEPQSETETFVALGKVYVRTATPSGGVTESGYDGNVGWSRSTAVGPELLTGKPLERLRQTAVLTPIAGRSHEVLGSRLIEGKPAWALRVVSQAGDENVRYFDAASGLMVAVGGPRSFEGAATQPLTMVGGYERFGEILVATTLTIRPRSSPPIVTTLVHLDNDSVDMRRFLIPADVRALIVSAPVSASPMEPAPSHVTAEAVLARHIAAIGGEAALRAIKARHSVMTMTIPGIIESKTETFVSNNKVLMRSTVPGIGETTSGYDGTVAWSMSDATGPTLLTDEQSAQLRQMADLAAVLKPRNSPRLLGQLSFEGKTVYAVRSEPTPGKDAIEYFDAESGLLAALVVPSESAPSEAMIVFGDYRRTGGILVAMTITARSPKAPAVTSRIVHLSYEPIDTAIFALPAEVRGLIKKP